MQLHLTVRVALCGTEAAMAPRYCCPTAVKGSCRGGSTRIPGHDRHWFHGQPQQLGGGGGTSPVTAPPPPAWQGVGQRVVPGEQSPLQQRQPHTTAASPARTSRVCRDTTGSAGSAATASCSLEPPARELAFIAGRRAPCHSIIHYLHEGSSSQNNAQAWPLGRMLQKTQTGSLH